MTPKQEEKPVKKSPDTKKTAAPPKTPRKTARGASSMAPQEAGKGQQDLQIETPPQGAQKPAPGSQADTSARFVKTAEEVIKNQPAKPGPNEILVVTADKISAMTEGRFSPEMVAVVKKTLAKGATDAELAYFLAVCKSVDLNPLNKEVMAYKDKSGNLVVLTGRDGFLRKAQMSPLWNGMTSAEVYDGDLDFQIDVPSGQVKHLISPNKPRGKLVGAYAITRPKGCEFITVEWAELKVHFKGGHTNANTWDKDPAAMIKKCAESHCLRKAFGMTVLQCEEDFSIVDNVAIPVDHVEVPTDLEIATRKIIDGLDKYEGTDKEAVKTILSKKQAKGELTLELLQDVGKKIGVEI